MTVAFAPGKLFIAGEYAVVAPGEPAILIAVNRGVTVSLTDRDGGGVVIDSVYATPLEWTIGDDLRLQPKRGHAPDLVWHTLEVCNDVLVARRGIALTGSLEITSTLRSDTGVKYGLGSSAAVTVALVTAVDEHFNLRLTDVERFKLALLATLRVSPRASGADIASSVLGGWIWYRSPDRSRLLTHVSTVGVVEAAAAPWNGLELGRLPSPIGVEVAVGWTGEPASTDSLVAARTAQGDIRRTFMEKSRSAVERLRTGLQSGSPELVVRSFEEAGDTLSWFDRATGGGIETPKLRRMRQLAHAHGVASKVSGAGGGDCGVALSLSHAPLSRIKRDWQSNGILPLDIDIDYEGARASTPEPEVYMSTADISHSRKDDHVRLATDQAGERQSVSDFDCISFVHHALRAIDISDVSSETTVLGEPWRSPMFINAMTGGTDRTGSINAALARVAHATGTPIASGSMSRVLKFPEVAETYRVLRRENPNGIVFANLSANASLDQARRVVDLIEADAIQIHVNSVQEVVMPEGDRLFSHWPSRIAELATAMSVPVIVKEVGFGMSHETLLDLIQAGVTAIDVSGRGGTNFARIENARRDRDTFTSLDQWGLTTTCSLLDIAQTAKDNGVTVFASGGIRGPLDVARALALGAGAVGIAGGFLHTLQTEGEEALIRQIDSWREELTAIQAILGATRPADLEHTSLLVQDQVREFAELRGIDVAAYARRGALTRRRIHG